MRGPFVVGILTLWVVTVSCAPDPRPDAVERTWSGSWSGASDQGSLEVSFNDRESFGGMTIFDVQLQITGGSCATAEGDQAGTDSAGALLGDDLRFAVQFSGGEGGVFRFEGVLLGSDSLTGRYTLTSARCDQCTCGLGASGTWQATPL